MRGLCVCVCVCVCLRVCVRARARGGILCTCERVCVGGLVDGCVRARAWVHVRVRSCVHACESTCLPLTSCMYYMHLALESAMGQSPSQPELYRKIMA